LKARPAAAATLKPCHGDLTLESQMKGDHQNGAGQFGLLEKKRKPWKTWEAQEKQTAARSIQV